MPGSPVWLATCKQMISFAVNYSAIAGFALLMHAVTKLKASGEQRSGGGVAGSLIYLAVSALLMGISSVALSFRRGLWGPDSTVDFWYNGTASDAGSTLVNNIIMLVTVIGFALFIRGVFYFLQAGQEQGQKGMIGKGVMALLVAVLCMNSHGTYKVAYNTMLAIFPDSLNIPGIHAGGDSS
jgi:hypothetical protein